MPADFLIPHSWDSNINELEHTDLDGKWSAVGRSLIWNLLTAPNRPTGPSMTPRDSGATITKPRDEYKDSREIEPR